MKPAVAVVVGALLCGTALSCGGARSAAPHALDDERKALVDGLKTTASTFGPRETMDRLEAAVRAKGMTVFARIDHAAGATEAGLSLRPTELLIFGNARAGTPLMQAQQTVGIDLPLKALVWQDAAGKTWLSYNEASWIVARHGADPALEPVASAMAAGLAALTAEATK